MNTNTTTRPSALSRSDLGQAIGSLSDIHRKLFELRVFDVLSHQEIAEGGFEGMTEREVRKEFSKAVEALRRTPQLQEALIQKASSQ